MTRQKHPGVLLNLLRQKLYSLEKFLLFLIFFLLPTQLSKRVWFPWSFLFGIRVDYLSFYLSLVDVLVYFLVFVYVVRKFLTDSPRIDLSVSGVKALLFLAVVNTIFSLFPLNTLLSFLRLIPFFLLFFYLNNFRRKEVLLKMFLLSSSLSLVFFGTIGVLQVLLGRTLGGVFWFLGERSFTVNTTGIALFSLFGRDFLRAYSTFPHPNVLSGFFVVVCLLLLSISYKYNYKKHLVFVVMFFSFLPFFLAFSLNSFISLLASFPISFLICRLGRNFVVAFLGFVFAINVFFVFFLPENYDFDLGTNIKERAELIVSARRVFLKNPIFGVGLNNFIPAAFYLGDKEFTSHLLQPVHNIFILFLVEFGVFGFLGFCFFLARYFCFASLEINFWLLAPLVFIMLTGLFDHYWLTLDQGRWVLVFVFSFLRKNGKRE